MKGSRKRDRERGTNPKNEREGMKEIVRDDREKERKKSLSYIRMTAFDRIGSKVLVDILDDQVTFVRTSKFLMESRILKRNLE